MSRHKVDGPGRARREAFLSAGNAIPTHQVGTIESTASDLFDFDSPNIASRECDNCGDLMEPGQAPMCTICGAVMCSNSCVDDHYLENHHHE